MSPLTEAGVSYLWDMIRSELSDAVGAENVLVSETDRLAYSVDIMWIPQMWVDHGLKPPMPDFVVLPGSTAEVSRVVKIAGRHRLPVIPCGGQSGSQGGTLPIYGGITMDLKRLDRVIEVDEQSLTVTAQAGINGQHLEWALQERGFTLAHYPASIHTATLGGYLAARGSGVLSTKYGKAEEMVLNLEVVLPDGSIVRSLPTSRHASGPDLMALFVGSEGTMGVITEATMRIDPIPETRRFRSYLFPNLHDGLEAGRRIMTSRLHPCVIRLYDPSSTIRTVKRVLGLDVQGAYMVLGFDGQTELVDLEARLGHDICQELGGEDLGAEAGQDWWEHRYDFYYPPFVKALPKLYGTTETQATYRDIERLYWAKKEAIETRFAAWKAHYYGHFSHWYPWGAMVYDQFMVDTPPDDPHEVIQLHNEMWACSARASLEHGGVLNEHHGIGLKLGWLMPEQYGAAWDLLARLKRTIDPDGIMNPGKLGFGPPASR